MMEWIFLKSKTWIDCVEKRLFIVRFYKSGNNNNKNRIYHLIPTQNTETMYDKYPTVA